MIATAWGWLVKHPRRAEVEAWVRSGGPRPAWVSADRKAVDILRDREIHRLRAMNHSYRQIAEAVGYSHQTVGTCLKVYAGEVPLPSGVRHRIGGMARHVLTKTVLENYAAGRVTLGQIMKLVGTEQSKSLLWWIRKRAKALGVTLVHPG